MKPALNKIIYPFLLPNGLLFLLAVVGLAYRLPPEVRPFLNVFPFAVLAAGLLLGWRFNRTRLVYAILLLLFADLFLLKYSVGSQRALIFQFIALLLPLNLLLISCFRERGWLNLQTLFWILLMTAEVVAVAWLSHEQASLSRTYLNYPLLEVPFLDRLPLSQPLLAASFSACAVFAWRGLRDSAAFETSFLWAQLVIIVGLSGAGVQPLRLYLASAGLILIIGIMETSHSLAYRDELTGLPGRRALNEALARLGSRYVLAMLDIDHFKKFNDTHGHDVGDQVLKMVASKLSGVKGGGKVFRYGGEEFAVIFPGKSTRAALTLLESLRRCVEEARFIPRGKDRPANKPKKRQGGKSKRSAALQVTISIGAAERNVKNSTTDQVLKAADQALYRAKKAGRNCVVG